jgi:hypothetical protein
MGCTYESVTSWKNIVYNYIGVINSKLLAVKVNATLDPLLA